MLQPTLNIKIYLDKTTGQLRVTNNTNWTSLGITPGNVYISLKIYTPAGAFYVNPNYNTPMTTPDITGASPTYTQSGLPLIAGEILEGEYKVGLKLFINNPSPETFDYEFIQTVIYEQPCIKIDHEIDCFCVKFKSIDKTNYTNTDQISYLHKIYYPSSLLLAPVSATTLVWSENRLANGTYVSEITTKRNFIFGPNYIVVDTLTGRKDLQVDCSGLCDIKCGFGNLWKKYKAACGKDKTEEFRLERIIQKVIALITLMNLTRNCGDSVAGNKYLIELKELLGGCKCGGGCESEKSAWITGICGSISGDDFDPTEIYDYINNINLALTTLIQNIQVELDALEAIVNELIAKSWFEGLTIPACLGFVLGDNEIQKRNKVLAKICQLNAAVFAPPIAKNDVSTTLVNTPVSNLVTLNDFATSNVTVNVTTAPSNGNAVVQPDGKTIKYTPNTSYVGVDTVGYTITDANAQTSSAVWTITVNAVPAVSCSIVNAKYSAQIYAMGAYLQFAIQNSSTIGTNVYTTKNYIIEIRDASNAILHSYTVTGSLTVDPSIFTTPDAFAPNWNNARIQQIIATNSATGVGCGTVTYETPTPFLLTDVGLSWFAGTTPPACLNFVVGDDEVTKRQKLMNAICAAGGSSVINGLSGTGASGTPIQLGGPLVQNTTIGGIFDMQNINRRQLYGNLTGPFYNTAFNNQEYFIIAQQQATNNNGSDIVRKNLRMIFALGSISAGVGVCGSNSNVEMVLTDNKTISNTNSVANDYKTLMLSPASGVTISATPNYPSIVNQAYAIICPDNNPGTINRPANAFYRPIETKANSAAIVDPMHIYLAALDGTDAFSKITGTKFAIYQAGVNDVSRFFGPVQNAGGTLQFTSDERGKENISDFNKGLAEIEQIDVKNFNLKWQKNKKVTGVIAQQVETVLPEAVTKDLFHIPDEDQKISDYRFLDQNVLFYTMLNAIKELSSQNKILEQRIKALETQ